MESRKTMALQNAHNSINILNKTVCNGTPKLLADCNKRH